MAYSRFWLDSEGAKYVLAIILQKLDELDEPFVTYSEVAELLEGEFDIPRIFRIHVGSVAGYMMDAILKVDDGAPLINALVTRENGIPGKGFAGYYDNHRRKKGGKQWLDFTKKRKVEVVQEIRDAVRRYGRWDEVFRTAFGERPTALEEKKYTERDGKPPEVKFPRGKGESEEHLRLKEWVRDNPSLLGLPSDFAGETEKGILSGDRLDVFFTNGADFAVVEVKSILSSDDDLQRGLYQCVKYRAVLIATELPVAADVRAILVTERELPSELKTRAKVLKVTAKVQKLNCK